MRASSLEAHEKSKPKKETHYKIIIKALKKINKASVSKTIAKNCSISYHEVARRLSEMEKKGIVEVVGRETNTPSRPLLWDLSEEYK